MSDALQKVAITCITLITGICLAQEPQNIKQPLGHFVNIELPSSWKEQTNPKTQFKEQWFRFLSLAMAANEGASPLCGPYRYNFDANGYTSAYRFEQGGSDKILRGISEIVWIAPQSGGELQVGDLNINKKELREEAKVLPEVAVVLEKMANDKSLMLVYRDGALLAVKPPSRQPPPCSFGMILVEPGLFQSSHSLVRYRARVGGQSGSTYFPGVFTAFPNDVDLEWFIAHELGEALIPAQFGGQKKGLYKRFTSEVNLVFSSWASKVEGTPEEKKLDKGIFLGDYAADYLAVYIGGNAGWSVDDFINYLEKRRSYVIKTDFGGTDNTQLAKRLREKLIRHWYGEMLASKPDSQPPFTPDPEQAIKAMETIQ